MKQFIIIIVLSIALVISCEYISEYDRLTKIDFLSGTDLSGDWFIDRGIVLTPKAADLPGNKQSYQVELTNMIDNGDFEASLLSADRGSWQFLINPPELFQTEFDGKMEGNNYLNLSLKRDTEIQLIYDEFEVVAGRDYIFRFIYKYITGWNNIQISYGNGAEEVRREMTPISDSICTAVIEVSPTADLTDYTVRIGYPENTTDTYSFNYYLDDMAFYENNNGLLYKYVIINNAQTNTYDLTDDGISYIIRPGKYRFAVYAKQDYRGVLVLNAGGKVKSFNVTSEYKQYFVDFYIYESQSAIIIGISPVSQDLNNKYPGSIIIGRPTLRMFE